jgi:hypothetical protein
MSNGSARPADDPPHWLGDETRSSREELETVLVCPVVHRRHSLFPGQALVRTQGRDCDYSLDSLLSFSLQTVTVPPTRGDGIPLLIDTGRRVWVITFISTEEAEAWHNCILDLQRNRSP